MKKYFLIVAFFALCILTFAQDTIPINLNYVKGSSVIDFLTLNKFVIGFVLFSIVEFFIGKSKKIKENSTLEIILNLLFKILKSIFTRKVS